MGNLWDCNFGVSCERSTADLWRVERFHQAGRHLNARQANGWTEFG